MCRIYSQDRFMNPGPAPPPPAAARPRLALTPEVKNLPGNMSSMSINSQQSAAFYSGSNTSATQLTEKIGGAFAVVKDGFARTKEEGFMRIWSEKWLVLRETQLDFHKSSNSPKVAFSIVLKDVTAVSRSETHPFSFEISRYAIPLPPSAPGVLPATQPKDAPIKTVICKVDTDDDVYSWIDSIYERCPGMGGVSNPTNFTHQVHVGFDPTSGAFIGLPPEWEKLLTNSAISKDDYQKNPTAVIEVLNFYTDKLMKHDDDSQDFHSATQSMQSSSTDMSSARQAAYAGSGGNSVAPPRPNPPNGHLGQDSYDAANSRSRNGQSPSNDLDSPMSPRDPQRPKDPREEERRRRAEEDSRRDQYDRDQRDRREQDRQRREREEQAAYNASLPKSRPPLAQQEVGGGAGGGYGNPGDSRNDWNPSRNAPQPPSSRERTQPQGSLRQGPQNQRIPAPGQNGVSPPKQQYANQSRPQSPGGRPAQPNGSNPAATRIPVVTKQGQAAQRAGEQAPAGTPKPLNVTIKQPTGAAAVAEAAQQLERPAPPQKDQQKRDARMSSMTEAEVMVRLREVVSKQLPLQSYNKQKKIGQGASGSVYVARIRDNCTSPMAQMIVQRQGPRAQVAIKQMDLRNQPRKELIVNEIVVMKDSKHKNIVNFIEAFLAEDPTELWVVMEFMEGGPLTDVIDNNPSISEEQIATICLEVCLDHFAPGVEPY